MEQSIKDAPCARLEPTNREILQAMLVFLKAQGTLIEIRLAG
jgi:hypothetical protein